MSLEIIPVDTIELIFVPVSCMDFALVSCEGALTMESVVCKGTFVCAMLVHLNSLAVVLCIFELSNVVQ